jgi:beta-lactamase regulating signal transducer with metallopeptidase domain
MDWQQLQSLYNQKTSVDTTGQLSPESKTSLEKSSVHIVPQTRSHVIRNILMTIVVLGIIAMALMFIMKYRDVRKTTRPVPTTETVKTEQQVRQEMIDEIVASQKENPIPAEQVTDVLTGGSIGPTDN